jgi:hypothetical protein
MITLDEVREFGTRFFDAVAGGASAAEQAQFFLNPHARIYMAWAGATISLKDYAARPVDQRAPLVRPFRSHAAQCIA